MADKPNVLVISAHAADFVWRAAGTIARYVQSGSKVRILSLSCGERGESGALWRERPGITEAEVVAIRKDEAQEAASTLGAEIRFLDWVDHPLVVDKDRLLQLAAEMREFRPQLLLTHHGADPLNPDHPVASEASLRAVRLAMVPGVLPETPTIAPLPIFMFEPDQPELCGFNPDTYIDITDVMDRKLMVMNQMKAQTFLIDNYTKRASYRGYLAGRTVGADIKYAEAFKRHSPFVGKFF